MNEYYSRQMILPEVGKKGQLRISNTHVLIVGAGGLGHPTAIYLAAAGVGSLTIMDFDSVELTNLNRQILFTPQDINKKKAAILAKKIQRQNPTIQVKALCEKLTVKNIEKIISPYSLLLDCTDNFTTKFLLHDFAWKQAKNLVQASIHQYEGQIQVFPYQYDKTKGCLRCLWPQIPSANSVDNCQQAGLIGATAGVMGVWQAMEAIKIILQLKNIPINTTNIIDLLNSSTRKIHWHKNPSCPLCSKNRQEKKFLSEDLLKYEIIKPNKNYILVDIREQTEIDHFRFSHKWKAICWPLSSFPLWKKDIKPQKKYLFICQKGIRSSRLVQKLRKESLNNCYSLHGGWDNV